MKSLVVSLICLIGFSQNQTLTLNITNIQHNNGILRIGVYDPNHGFGSEEEKPTYWKLIPITKLENQTVTFEVPSGRYAVAVYHDLNENKKLDKNRVGFPKEPYGFSNNYRPKFSRPTFANCAFEIGDSPKTMTIKLL